VDRETPYFFAAVPSEPDFLPTEVAMVIYTKGPRANPSVLVDHRVGHGPPFEMFLANGKNHYIAINIKRLMKQLNAPGDATEFRAHIQIVLYRLGAESNKFKRVQLRSFPFILVVEKGKLVDAKVELNSLSLGRNRFDIEVSDMFAR
jgi:hypothetical protein